MHDPDHQVDGADEPLPPQQGRRVGERTAAAEQASRLDAVREREDVRDRLDAAREPVERDVRAGEEQHRARRSCRRTARRCGRAARASRGRARTTCTRTTRRAPRRASPASSLRVNVHVEDAAADREGERRRDEPGEDRRAPRGRGRARAGSRATRAAWRASASGARRRSRCPSRRSPVTAIAMNALPIRKNLSDWTSANRPR